MPVTVHWGIAKDGIIINSNRLALRIIFTQLGVQSAVKQNKTKEKDTTQLVCDNLRHKISFEKKLEFCGTKTPIRLNGREFHQRKKKTCHPRDLGSMRRSMEFDRTFLDGV